MSQTASTNGTERDVESGDATGTAVVPCCGNIAEARDRLAKAALESPENGELPLALGHLEMSLGNYEAARAAYRNAAILLPGVAQVHSGLAMACQKLGRPTEAGKAALRAVALNLEDKAALKVLARIHLDAWQHEAAARTCRAILRIDDRDADAGQMMEEAMVQEAKLAENLLGRPPLFSPPAMPPKISSRRARQPALR
jgi:tetratricopeptide (TPR) repeat protein